MATNGQLLRRFAGVACLLASSLVCSASYAQNPNEFEANQAERNPGQVVSLEDQLVNGLRAFTPDQKAYLHLIATRVDQGIIPRAMVNVIYDWAIKRNPHVPYPYFQIALRALGERRGIPVP